MLRRSILASLLAAPAMAQTPERSLRLIIAFPPGGSTDILARLMAPRMGELLGGTVTPENRSGASGAVGAGFVAQAAPDGATILIDSGGQSVNPFLMRGLAFDYVRDLAPITLLATLPLILITRTEYGVADLAGLLARLRANEAIDIDVISPREESHDDVSLETRVIDLARELGGRVITIDASAAKLAGVRSVPAINVNDVAVALKPTFVPGDALSVRLVKQGEEPDQGIGYLEDGTMVVVENGRDRIGSTVRASVTSTLQTSAGRLVFARPA